MKKSPLLSIVIPTCNRYDTLFPVLKSLLNWNADNIEIIIQDNSTDNSDILRLFESGTTDNRVKYFYTKQRLSAIENCDLAIGNANGTFVTFIGDDDGLVSSLVRVCGWMLDNNIDSMSCNVPLYTWNNMEHAVSINRGFNGKLIISKYTGFIEYIDAKSELKKLVYSGAQNMYKIPKVYQGVVAKRILDNLKQIAGTYFPGPVPDMSNAVAISSLIKKHCYIDLPLIIAGHSKRSMSGKNSKRLHQGEISQEKSLSIDTADKWSQKIPFFWSAPTIWAEAALQALNKMDLTSLVANFNYAIVYANCFTYCDKSFYNRIISSMFHERNLLSKISILFQVLYYYFIANFKRLKNLLNKIILGIHGIEFSDISDVMNYCNSISVNFRNDIK